MSNHLHKTPTQLQHEFKLPAYMGSVMLPRGWMSCKDQAILTELLETQWGLMVSKSVPRPGDPPKVQDANSQYELGLQWGQDRSTTNRHLQKFCFDTCAECQGKGKVRSDSSGMMESCATCDGKGVIDADVLNLVRKYRPGIGVVNHYHDLVQAGNGANVPRADALLQWNPARLAEQFGEEFFDGSAEGLDGCGEVPMFIFSPNILEPIRCTCRLGQMTMNFKGCLKCGRKGYTFDLNRRMRRNPRLVLAVLILKGLRSLPYLEMTSEAIGKLCGLCENTVAACLDQWEDLKVLQIAPGQVYYGDTIDPKTGKPAVKFRKPQRIIWLPGLLLDHDVRERERKRFDEAAEVVFLSFGLTPSLRIARQRHEELLTMWHLTRHSVGSLWSYLHRWLVRKEGCDRREVDLLFPLHKAWPGG